MRLGISPAATSTPTGVFNQRFEALFPHTRSLVCMVCITLPPPPFLPVYLCSNVGLWGPPAAVLPESSPLGCLSLPLLLVWMNVSSLSPWLLDFHAVPFSVSSGCFLFLNCCCLSFGCARRRSVPTYASILSRSRRFLFKNSFTEGYLRMQTFESHLSLNSCWH